MQQFWMWLHLESVREFLKTGITVSVDVVHVDEVRRSGFSKWNVCFLLPSTDRNTSGLLCLGKIKKKILISASVDVLSFKGWGSFEIFFYIKVVLILHSSYRLHCFPETSHFWEKTFHYARDCIFSHICTGNLIFQTASDFTQFTCSA